MAPLGVTGTRAHLSASPATGFPTHGRRCAFTDGGGTPGNMPAALVAASSWQTTSYRALENNLKRANHCSGGGLEQQQYDTTYSWSGQECGLSGGRARGQAGAPRHVIGHSAISSSICDRCIKTSKLGFMLVSGDALKPCPQASGAAIKRQRNGRNATSAGRQLDQPCQARAGILNRYMNVLLS